MQEAQTDLALLVWFFKVYSPLDVWKIGSVFQRHEKSAVKGGSKWWLFVVVFVAWRGEEKNISKRLLVAACKCLKIYYHTKYNQFCTSEASVDLYKDPK